jgi:hypothetical protein
LHSPAARVARQVPRSQLTPVRLPEWMRGGWHSHSRRGPQPSSSRLRPPWRWQSRQLPQARVPKTTGQPPALTRQPAAEILLVSSIGWPLTRRVSALLWAIARLPRRAAPPRAVLPEWLPTETPSESSRVRWPLMAYPPMPATLVAQAPIARLVSAPSPFLDPG